MTDILVRPDIQVAPSPVFTRRTTWTRGLSLLVLAIVLLVPAGGLLRQTGQGQLMEEGMMILDPYRLVHGAVAYRDFDYLWGPGGLWVPAVVQSLFGWTEAVSRLVGFAYAAFGTLAVYALARRWSEPLGLAAGICMALIDRMSALPEYAAIAFGILALYFGYRSLIGRGRRATRFALWAGLAGGAALLYRPDRGVGVALALTVIFWGHRERLYRAAVGFGIGVALFLAYGLWAGLGATIDNVFWSALHVPAERHLPLPFSDWPMDLWMALVVVALVTDLYAGWRRRRINSASPKGPVLLGAAIFSACLIPEFLQRSDAGHLLVAGSLAVAMLPVALADLSLAAEISAVPWATSLRYALAVAAIFGVGAYQEAIFPYVQAAGVTVGVEQAGTITVSNQSRTFTYYTGEAHVVVHLIEWVEGHTKPGQTLFVGPGDLSRTPYSDNSLPLLLPELRDAMHFPDMNPLVAIRHGSLLASDVASANVLILDQQLDQWNEPNESADYGSQAANRVVQNEFCPEAQFATYEILLRCAAPGT